MIEMKITSDFDFEVGERVAIISIDGDYETNLFRGIIKGIYFSPKGFDDLCANKTVSENVNLSVDVLLDNGRREFFNYKSEIPSKSERGFRYNAWVRDTTVVS